MLATGAYNNIARWYFRMIDVFGKSLLIKRVWFYGVFHNPLGCPDYFLLTTVVKTHSEGGFGVVFGVMLRSLDHLQNILGYGRFITQDDKPTTFAQ